MKILLLIIPIFCSVVVEARKITGRVLDSETQKPVRSANIIIFSSTQGTTTNHLGFFSLEINNQHSELIISSKGYQTSNLKIPEEDQFKILLNREYLLLPEFDLGRYIKKELPLFSDNNVLGGKIVIAERDAEYPGGLEYFFNDLGARLKTESFSTHFSDSVKQIDFTISPQGIITDIQFSYPNEDLSLLLTTAMSSLIAWKPAIQNNLMVAQYYSIPIKWSKTANEVFVSVEESATPPMGMPDFYRFIGNSLNYPAEARRLGIEGKVFVEFIVNRDGSLTDFKVLKGIGGGCDGEALRAISRSPNWIPGKQKGIPVKQKMVMPIIFSIGGTSNVRKGISDNDIQYDFYKWVGGTIRYPATARKMGIEGWVYAEIKINKNSGEILSSKLLKDIGAECGKEVLRVISTISSIAVLGLNPKKETLILPVIFGLSAIPKNNSSLTISTEEAELLKPIEIVAVGVERERRVTGYNSDFISPDTRIQIEKSEPLPESFSDVNRKATTIMLVAKGIDSIPANINEYKKLKSLDLENNLIENIPVELTQMKLTSLFMPINRLKNLPDDFANLQSLTILGLAQNQFSEFPLPITKLKEIKALDLAENKIEIIPEEIGGLNSLEELYLQNNKIKTLPESISKLKNLKKLYLEGNPISEEEKKSLKERLPRTEILF